MIKRFCDMCGTIIDNRDFRKLSMTDADSNYILANGECVCDTAQNIELCRNCASKVMQFIKSGDLHTRRNN